jgi:hypothetical protein
LITSCFATEGNVQAVPAVNGDDGHGQVNQFFFREVFASHFVNFIRNVVLADLGHRFGPGQCRPLAVSKERRISPNGDGVKPLLAFAAGSRILCVHVHTVGTTINLRGSQVDQVQQRMLQTALVHVFLQAMTRISSTTSSTMWVAIYIAKVHNQVLVEFPNGRRRHFRMANTLTDFTRLGAFLASSSGCTCRIAFEATGDYHCISFSRIFPPSN